MITPFEGARLSTKRVEKLSRTPPKIRTTYIYTIVENLTDPKGRVKGNRLLFLEVSIVDLHMEGSLLQAPRKI